MPEGPGNRATHDALSHDVKIADDPFHRFNTPAAVFFDHETDFMRQAATISGRGDLMLMLVLASMEERCAHDRFVEGLYAPTGDGQAEPRGARRRWRG